MTARNRIQASLELIDRDWVQVADRELFYVVICKTRERLCGWDYLIDSHPPPGEGVTTQLFGMLQGPNVRCRLLWLLDTLQIDRANLPDLQ
jgi:hypothetical protein